mmetsp:Transcript_87076/g.164135  ORF Transcript_87076/g.164135 Transcript_87076/m.164135 type:complete len:412 (-) Transcript_87076:29-1264(-)
MDMGHPASFLLYLVVVIPAYSGGDLNQPGDVNHAFTTFSDTYMSMNDEEMNIKGLEPSLISGRLPVFVWLMGGFSMFDSMVDEVWLQQMALRGFLSAAVDYVSFYDRLTWSSTFTGPARQFQTLQAKAEKLPNAISKLCLRPRADCSQGVAVAGHSTGGFISIFGVQYDNRITAILALGVGCLDDKLVGGLLDVEVSKYLLPSKRLYITGSKDKMVDPYCLSDMNKELQADGSGYMMVPEGPHQFYASCDPIQRKTLMKCAYSKSIAPWGLTKSLDWLARTASPASAKINTPKEAVECEGKLPISETAQCTGGRDPWIYVVLILVFVVIFPIGAAIYCCLHPVRRMSSYSSLGKEEFKQIADEEMELLRRFSDSSSFNSVAGSERPDFRNVQRQELEHLESFVGQQTVSRS